MNETETAKRVLVSVGIALVNAERLMESEDQNIRVFALDAYTKLAEVELALLNMLGIKPQYSDDVNPLARRARLDR